MSQITMSELKKMNRQKVYRLIYQNGSLTKHNICSIMNISRPTATQFLDELTANNKIYIGGKDKLAHGRPAFTYCFNPNARISIGVEIMADKIKIAAVNLAGEIVKSEIIRLAFINSESYFQHASSWIKAFIFALNYDTNSILGITLSFQGIISHDNEHITYSKLLTNTPFKRSDFAKYFDAPVSLEHDSEMATVAELWHYNQICNAVHLFINPYMGSGVIVNGSVLHTPDLSSGAIEHLTLHDNGELCYCGKNGCADAYCSVNTLERRAGKNINELFKGMHAGNVNDHRIFDEYLHDLALLINNVQMVIPGDIIIGGLLSQYIHHDDIDRLKQMIQQISTFKKVPFEIYIGYYGSNASLVGSALMNISKYLIQEGLR